MSPWKAKLFALVILCSLVWITVLTFPSERLKIVACDVGQGDAILIIKGNNQILIDGGPGSKVVDCLSKYVPYWDRRIEIVVLTHPQSDHFGGLIEVFKLYEVDTFLANSLDSGSESYKALKTEVGGSQARVINPSDRLRLGLGTIYLDILSPTENYLSENSSGSFMTEKGDDVKGVLGAFSSKVDPNEFSIVLLMHYGEFDALFTGDMPPFVSKEISQKIKTVNNNKPLEYIKIPHHGSKNGLTEDLIINSGVDFAAISVGKNNSYGHPSPEVISMLSRHGVQTERTDQKGDIVIETDGLNLIKN